MTTLVLTAKAPTLRPTWNAVTTADSDTNAWYFYDYAGQDPINAYDLDGKCNKKNRWYGWACPSSLASDAEQAGTQIVIGSVNPVLLAATQYGTLSVSACQGKACGGIAVHDGKVYVQAGGLGDRGVAVLWSPGGVQKGVVSTAGLCLPWEDVVGCGGGTWKKGTVFGGFVPVVGLSSKPGAWGGYTVTKQVWP